MSIRTEKVRTKLRRDRISTGVYIAQPTPQRIAETTSAHERPTSKENSLHTVLETTDVAPERRLWITEYIRNHKSNGSFVSGKFHGIFEFAYGHRSGALCRTMELYPAAQGPARHIAPRAAVRNTRTNQASSVEHPHQKDPPHSGERNGHPVPLSTKIERQTQLCRVHSRFLAWLHRPRGRLQR